jgi:hypothetical protein
MTTPGEGGKLLRQRAGCAVSGIVAPSIVFGEEIDLERTQAQPARQKC